MLDSILEFPISANSYLLRGEQEVVLGIRSRQCRSPPRLIVAGGVLFRLALAWLVLVTSGRLEACDGATIHRCQPGTVGSPRSVRWGEHPSLPTW